MSKNNPEQTLSVDVRRIPRDAENALLVLATEGLPSQLHHLTLVDAQWGGKPCPEIKRIEIGEDGSLGLEGTLPTRDGIVREGVAWDSGIFTARVPKRGTLTINNGTSHVICEGLDTTARVEGWAWHVDDDAATLWAAALQFSASHPPYALWPSLGNLVLDGHPRRGWCFETPFGLAFLIRRGDGWFIVFWNGTPQAPSNDDVTKTLTTIGFVVGEELRLRVLHSIREDGAGVGLRHYQIADQFSRSTSREQPTLPFRVAPTWTARFVEGALRFHAQHADAPLVLGMNHYFSSFGYSVDADFLHAWIGAEAIAKWGLVSGLFTDGGPLRLADRARWKSWVDANERAIKSHAVAGMEQSLFDSVKGSEIRRPSPVQRVFRGAGLPWSAAMDDAEHVRNGVAHEGVIPGARSRDGNKDLARVGLARTLLTALLAKLIGYDGPISDRSKNASSIADWTQPDWWGAAELGRVVEYRGADDDSA